MSTAPAILIAGTHSGCGKTTVTLAIMAALVRRGLQIVPFKCGPDFIDPTLHEMVTGQVSRNLDVRMCGKDFVRATFSHHLPETGFGVVEGVMGLFDGGTGSAAHLAKTLGIPVILVVDVRSAAESVAAVVKGFATLDPDLKVAGVICNRVGSARHKELIEEALKPLSLPVLGFLPRNENITIPSRHLGLHMGTESPLQNGGIDALAALCERHLAMENLLQLAQGRNKSFASQENTIFTTIKSDAPPVRIGVAKDAAFCFYYADNLELLRLAGAELVFFSPLADKELPQNLAGLYLGGGYPELYAQELAANESMRESVKKFSIKNKPLYAECGGFMYLCDSLENQDGEVFPMCAVYPFPCAMNAKLRKLGYRNPHLTSESILGSAGTALFGHEFHYSTIIEEGTAFQATGSQGIQVVYHLEDDQKEGYYLRQTLAGYVHLHWGRTPEAAAAFVNACRFFLN